MSELWGIALTLLTGGKFLGLTLTQYAAIAAALQKAEPQLVAAGNQLLLILKSANPEAYAALMKAIADGAKASTDAQVVPTIPGYGADGGRTEIPNPG